MNLDYFSKIRILDGGMGQTLLEKGLKAKGSLWSASALIEKKYLKFETLTTAENNKIKDI